MPADMESGLKISTLGGLTIQLDGERIKLATRKAEALLVYLVSLRRDQPREILATLLWEEQSQVRALASLRAALANLRKHLGSYIHATRTSIGLARPDIWFDVEELERCLESANIEAAIELFQGQFLDGLYVRGAANFENWLVAESGRIQQLVRSGLQEHASRALSEGRLEGGLAATRKLLDMDPLDELAQRQRMTLLARSGQRAAALEFYEECRQLLWEELGIEPEEASRNLSAEIKSGRLDMPAGEVARPGVPAVAPPAFLEDLQDRGSSVAVVAREAEIARLKALLSRAAQGQGLVAFVTGTAGQGKTTLVAEFIRQALQESRKLLVASGYCSDYAGLGAPYLPFRDVLAMVTGDVERRWSSGSISREHALRQWEQTPAAIQALLDYGPYLVDLLVPAADLIARASAIGSQDTAVPDRLVRRLEEQTTRQAYLEQSHIFEQLTNVLRAIAQARPLLITLDDFQWADLASISLLFHLGRRITDAPIMVLCAYRRDEISRQAAEDTSHPLEKVLSELKRLFGDTWIELDETREEAGRAFVDAVLDSEPNQLGEDFRTTLYAHTGGMPLFTVELLRAMQIRGDLVQENGAWKASKNLDWGILPARVDAVIEERVDRLDAALRETLSIACVEGEAFTAQVIAAVQGADLRGLIRRISQELFKRHQIVRQNSAAQVGEVRLFRYRFHHILFQKHLYEKLEPVERELLHQEVAAALEKLYGGQSGDIAAELAFHYRKAGDLLKARQFYLQAGERAQAIYANKEAVEFYTQALALTPEVDTASRLDLLLAREKIHSLQGNRKAQESDLEALETLAHSLDDTARQAGVALRWAGFRELTGDYTGSAEAASRALELARQSADPEGEAQGLLALGLALLRQGEYESAGENLRAGLATAQRLALDQLAGECLTRLGLLHQWQGKGREAQSYYERALEIYQRLGNRLQEAWVLNSIGNIVFDLWQYHESLARYQQALAIFREVGNQQGEGYVLHNVGHVSASIADFQQAQGYYREAQVIFEAIDHPLGTGATFINLGESAWFQEDHETSRDCYEQALQIFRRIGNRTYESYALTGLGNASLSLGELEAASNYYRPAIALDEELGNLSHSMEARAGLAQVALAQADAEPAYLDEAFRRAVGIVDFLEQGNQLATGLSTFWIYLTCYQVLLERQDPRAERALQIGHAHWKEWSGQIADRAVRNALATRVKWIRAILNAVGDPD